METMIANFPAYKVMRRSISDWKSAPAFKAGEILAIKRNGYYDRFRLGSVVSVALHCNEDPVAAFEQEKERGNPLWWAIKVASSLSHQKEQGTVYEVEFGDKIIFEGFIFELYSAPNQNMKLVKIGPAK